MMLLRRIALLLLTGLFAQAAVAFTAFRVADIRVEGLQRITAGTLFTYLPVQAGSVLDQSTSSRALRALFATGFFDDVRFEREADVLVVQVVERPGISEIEITGNKEVDSEDLEAGLKEIGFAAGRVFNRSLLDQLELELRRLYFAQGRYGVAITPEVTQLPRNRVAISVNIEEGEVAQIRKVSFVGNESFKDKELRKKLSLGEGNWLSFITKNNRYSKQKLAGDLESIRSFYLDRGYVNFRIDSTQVSISPDKQDIYITINMTEGDVFSISEVKLAGNLVLEPEALYALVKTNAGQPFSRRKATATTQGITDKLGDEGFAFANVNSVPDIDNDNKTVALTYFVDPGKRVYVRRINISGNTKTRDEVIRREMRQMESSAISTKNVKRSRDRLRRLNYFDDVTFETPQVAGSDDEVNIDISVKEKPSGTLLAGIGFSQSQGIILNGSVTQDNFLGTGKRVSIGGSNSSAIRSFNLAYTNPYYTLDGISRGFDIRYRSTDAAQVDISDYQTDISFLGVNYGVPISEFNTVRFTFGWERTDITAGVNTPDEIRDFLDTNGESFDNFKFTASFTHDTRDSAVFTTRGTRRRLLLEASTPGSDLEFYKLSYRHQYHRSIAQNLVLVLDGDFGYADAYGNTNVVPFFENFFAGGIRSVRGYQDNTLGPRDSLNDPLGGALKLVFRTELQFPVWFRKDSKNMRMGVFLDAGNVFADDVGYDFGEIRYSTGVSASWLSPFGALVFSVGVPLNAGDRDEKQPFQFTFGSAF